MEIETQAHPHQNGSSHHETGSDTISVHDLVDAYLIEAPSPFNTLHFFKTCYLVCKTLEAAGSSLDIDFRLDLRAHKEDTVVDKPYSSKLSSYLWELVDTDRVEHHAGQGTFAARLQVGSQHTRATIESEIAENIARSLLTAPTPGPVKRITH